MIFDNYLLCAFEWAVMAPATCKSCSPLRKRKNTFIEALNRGASPLHLPDGKVDCPETGPRGMCPACPHLVFGVPEWRFA
ncbi:hypothetical protein VTI74DRAFT_9085 [Chaetomium olivicolor]